MARKKKIPSVIINYDSLSDDLKALYDKVYGSFDEKTIFKLRDEARTMNVESPTTLSKNELRKRMTDRIISDYLPAQDKTFEGWEVYAEGMSGELVRGIVEDLESGCRIGKAFVPATLKRDNDLRYGDKVEGHAVDQSGEKVFINITSVEGEEPKKKRLRFEDFVVHEKRNFTDIDGTAAAKLLPGLKKGERVIINNMSFAVAQKIVQSFPQVVGLFVGLSPEQTAELDEDYFKTTFDMTKYQTLRVARLALERAKRLCERGEDVVFVVFGMDTIGDRDTERMLFGVGRCFMDCSVTVITDVSPEKELGAFARIATTIKENQEI